MTSALRDKLMELGERGDGLLREGDVIALLDEHCAGQRVGFEKWWQDKINANYFYQTENRGYSRYKGADVGVCQELFCEGWQAAIATVTKEEFK